MVDLSSKSPESRHEHWMAQALTLAGRGVGLASPNPTVGCVIVQDGRLIGTGFHEYERRDHAEVVALREAGELARGATAYVTLEPCSHYGRTGPCADALIAAGVGSVVVATADANPTVHGRGMERLRQAGIDVTVGILETSARRLNDAFAKYISTGFPYVTIKSAMTLDGRIAPPASSRIRGEIAWITGPESRQQVQLLRHSVDAVITGIGTVLSDDPLLTDRSGLPRRRPLLRIVLDSELRLPLESKLVQSAKDDLLVICTNPCLQTGAHASANSQIHEQRIAALAAAGVTVKQIIPDPGKTSPALPELLRQLGEMQITSVMVEAGSGVNASFLDAALVDRLFLFYAPSMLGADGLPLIEKAPSQKPGVRDFTLHRYGSDFAFEGRLTDPWPVQSNLPDRLL
ncbi:Diaminohydroxyphosphoribosylaminopyrimidine deaminase [Acidisarcina polymorpha]|uniref:Riboflavin biosynthesis protein RibD n=1 Tax=Acidisarcina polymorpha TaxID=2211140 RepID=A0A2Z5G3M5_9BACT|nr:bifunctional diaminohydroxyphosphoribosylaminopyrimidine deaminase/5-amino-6-(5-phosphoribosylamino)uracil reductase RibD [Acidisarcina polymorpha]AXC13708.1 Diaminohydroxyphosphoribosylaminopyrimidine deaminase [Acidisarcina polymorpha]